MTNLRDLLDWLRAAAACDDYDDCPVAAARHRQAADEIERLQIRVAELEAENAALAENVYDLSPSDFLTEQDVEALISAVTGESGEGVGCKKV